MSTALWASVLALISVLGSAYAQPVKRVIHISMDGLRPDAITALGPTNLPHFYRMRAEGAFTDNARTDYDYSITLPNHVCQLTGRGVVGPAGHGWMKNSDPAANETLASSKGSYVAGVFDVVHDNGRKTGMFDSKSKFSIFVNSWNAVNGQPDVTGPDNGRNKIDYHLSKSDTAALVKALTNSLSTQLFDYAFLHFADPDSVGHTVGWDITPGSKYSNVIKALDTRLGMIFDLIDNDPRFRGTTAIILTADHGGTAKGHADPAVREDFTVPFYVWGPGVPAGADLYALNPGNRVNPGTNRPDYLAAVQPIRNGEAANLALKLLGLGPVPGSTINNARDLEVGRSAAK